jgi:hypothetical protein
VASGGVVTDLGVLDLADLDLDVVVVLESPMEAVSLSGLGVSLGSDDGLSLGSSVGSLLADEVATTLGCPSATVSLTALPSAAVQAATIRTSTRTPIRIHSQVRRFFGGVGGGA